MPVPALPVTAALERRLAGRPLILFLDVDGTLSPIAPRPEDAVVAPEMKQLLRDYAALPNSYVVIVSGRGANDARRLVDVEMASVIGNHGIEVAPAGGPPFVRDDVASYEPAVAEAAKRIVLATHEMRGVQLEDKRWTLSVHYRLADQALVTSLERAIADIGTELGLRVTRGKKVLELRPPIDLDKGIAAVELARSLGGLHDGASIFCAGDDETDEDAFRALRAAHPASVTVRVCDDAVRNPPDTAAEFLVHDTDGVRSLLESVLERRRRAI